MLKTIAKGIALLFLLLVLVVGALKAWKAHDEPAVISVLGFNKTDALVGQPAPNLTLPRVGGGEASLTDFRGKKAVLFFWATWCPSCDEMLPILTQFQRDTGGFEVVTVTFRERDGLDAAAVDKAIAEKLGQREWTNLRGDDSVADRFRLKAIPNVVVVDGDGQILYTGIGKHTPEMLRDALDGRS